MTMFAIVVSHKLTRIFMGAYYYESILLCCFELPLLPTYLLSVHILFVSGIDFL